MYTAAFFNSVHYITEATGRDELANEFNLKNKLILILMYLLTLNISTVWRIESEERMVFLGGHTIKY